MRLSGVFNQRVRGFRIIELAGLAVLITLVLGVYLAKAGAGGKRADIDRVQDQIVSEKSRIRLLQAEVANLERPERLEALSARYLGMQPVAYRQEVQPDALPDLALESAVAARPAPAAPSAAAPATAPDPAGADH